jgi:AbrB family looped-hinge helix DNA binding protein
MIHTMTTTIDAAGRLVIPGPVRREAALEPGMPLDVRWRDGIIEIEPQPLPVSIERRGRLLVARPKVKVRPLGTAAVERTRREISTGRGRR